MPFNPNEYDGRPLSSLVEDLAARDHVAISAEWQHKVERPLVERPLVERPLFGKRRRFHARVKEDDPSPPIESDTTRLMQSADTRAHLPPDHPDVSITDVTLETYLGGSGQGWVWAAQVLSTGRLVAVKILAGDYVEMAGLAAREAIICAKFRHPNIIRVFHAEPAGSYWVVIMELVQGDNLANLCHFTSDHRFFGQLADAVRTMSDSHVVHRDLKPANIVLRTSDESPVVVDFGLAVDLETPEWNRKGIAGTPLFMCPEAILGRTPDVSWDAYSLGITAAEILLDETMRESYRFRGIPQIVTAKKIGRFDRAFRDTVQQISDGVLRQWCLNLTDSESRVRIEAIRDASRWSKANQAQ